LGVNNLSKVVTQQRGGRGSNSRPQSHQSDTLATRLSSHAGLLHIFVVVIRGFDLVSVSTRWEIGWEAHPKMICFVLNGMLNFNSISQPSKQTRYHMTSVWWKFMKYAFYWCFLVITLSKKWVC